MKHPALTRAMAVVLIIVCVIMLLAGISGLGKAQKERAADEAAYEKLTGRIETVQQLTEKLAGKPTYQEASEKLEAQQQQHDEDASEYRTDLAERTATQGGYQKGADALWEAKAQTDAAVNGYRQALAQFSAKEAEFNAMKQQAEAQIAQLQGAAAQLGSVPDPGSPPTFTEQNPADTWTPEQQAADPDGFAAAQQTYANAQTAFQQQLGAYQVAAQAYQGALAQANGMLAAAGLGAVDSLAAASAMLSGAAANIQKQLSDGAAALEAGRQQLAAAGEQVTQAQGKVQGGLEQIWYKLDQMEDEEAELAENRDRLMEESAQLQADREALDALKEDERTLASTRAILKGYDGVKTRVEAGGELVESAQAYAGEFYDSYHRLYTGRILLCALEIAGSLLGLACMPAAFEKSKSRLLLLVPAVLCFACATAAECLGLSLGLGQSYAAIPAMLFALLYLLAAAPKRKTPA